MEQNNTYNTANTTTALRSDYGHNMNTNYDHDNGQNSKLMKGIVIGGIIGGALAMLDSTTRTKVKTKAMDLKDSSANLISEVRENPGDVKENMINQFKSASNTLKEAIKDAQSLYQRVNDDVFGNMDMVKEVSNDAMSTAKEAKSELADIGSKVKDAGSELMESPVENGGNSSGSNYQTTSSMNSSETAFPVERDESAITYSPDTQENSKNL
ncbi:hypothetical protein AF332_25130 [Sporosarcina globispora]|uniref:General stress protein n=1 Tax=Sporosarcina globispora TaxID=1459 RepID=A0A0M0GIM1_SPOGL|nr:hypothetical protein [Sporosarcina globispora]KON89770.1 hypothetical protein AF332_25130 [Sporosarcina globispora]